MQYMWRGIQKPRLHIPNLTSLLQSDAMSRTAATRPMQNRFRVLVNVKSGGNLTYAKPDDQ